MWFFGNKEDCHTRDGKYKYAEKLEFSKKHAKFGDIRKAKKGNEELIIKIQDLNKDDEVFWTEAWLFNRANRKTSGIVPKFYDVWVCDDKGYIAMENWLAGYPRSGSLKDFEDIFRGLPKEAQVKVTLKLFDLFYDLHTKAKIQHNDIREPNILFRIISDPNIKSYVDIEFNVIDFGLSENLKGSSKKEQLNEIMYDYINVLDMLDAMGAKFTKLVDFKYNDKIYCVLSPETDPAIQTYLSGIIQEYNPGLDNYYEYFKKSLNIFNAGDIRHKLIKPGRCVEKKMKREITLEDMIKRKKSWVELTTKVFGPVGAVPILVPK